MRRHEQGFTLWEMLIVIALVITLLITALENLLPLRGAAERASFVTTINHLRSAMGMTAAQRAVRNGMNGLVNMAGANPVEWLAVPPGDYVGEIHAGGYESVPPGSWAFDADNGWLVYRIRYTQYAEGGFGPIQGVRFQVVVTRGRSGEVREVVLEQIDSVEWQIPESEIRRWLERTT